MFSFLILFQSVYQWIVKPQTIIKSNDLFLPGRMTFVYDMVMLFFFFTFYSRIVYSASTLLLKKVADVIYFKNRVIRVG